jgi:hypothetical protein
MKKNMKQEMSGRNEVTEPTKLPIDMVCVMDETRKPAGYWTLERCMASAKPHPNPKAWKKAEISAYQAAVRNGWLPECYPYMKTKDVKPAGYWTLERCKASAKPHPNSKAWKKAEQGAYDAAQRNGWLPECCVNMEKRNTKPSGYWTLERCKASAKPHPNKKAWEKAEQGAYDAAKRNGWLELCCAHMVEREFDIVKALKKAGRQATNRKLNQDHIPATQKDVVLE